MSLKHPFPLFEQKVESKVKRIQRNFSLTGLAILVGSACLLTWGYYGYIRDYKGYSRHVNSTKSAKEARELIRVPFAEDIGLVKNIKKISISGFNSPYNSSLISYKDGYLLFFRYDVPGTTFIKKQKVPFKSFIGCVELDKFFRQKKTPTFIKTGSEFSEDPRVFKVGERIFLTYNDIADSHIYGRTIRLAEINPEDWSLKFIKDLDLNLGPVEKNWVPFEYTESNGKSGIYFAYAINPHKIIKVEDNSDHEIKQFIFPFKDIYQKLPWPEKWGVLRGGTPALLLDDQYLAFFHSSFKDKRSGKVFYVMGAYTFEKNPPFKVTAVSKFPILFKTLYDTQHSSIANTKLRCLFPSGFVVENVRGKDIIHVSCGENDSGIKIVTIDKDSLYQTLEPISTECVFPKFENTLP